MKVLIAISRQKGFADALENIVLSDWRVIHHESLEEEGLLRIPGAVDLIALDADLTSSGPIKEIGLLKKMQAEAPLLLIAGESRQEWIEEAYLAGASYILPKPMRQKLVQNLIDRLFPVVKSPEVATSVFAAPETGLRDSPQSISSTLGTLRNLGRVLNDGLVSDALPKRFLELLRETLAVNRAAIFLRKPFSSIKSLQQEAANRGLNAACAVGLPAGLLQYFELSLEGGIGLHLLRSGRILRGDSPEIRENREIQKEFELLGAKVAIPILDRGTLIGVAVFDERITGEPLTNSELALIFHALEELGLAIKNCWLRDEITRNHDLMTEILDGITSGCVVIAQDLQVIHCNPAARRFLLNPVSDGRTGLQFSDFPQVLGSRVFESLKTGVTVAAFRYRPAENPDGAYHVSVIPFDRDAGKHPTAALMLIEDYSQLQRSQRLEIEASNLRMVRSMAEHLSHEIGNALVPMSTHQQLLGEKYDDPEFRGSLSLALTQGIKRISRLSNQLLYLSRDDALRHEPIAARKLIEDAFSDAQTLYGLDGRHLEIKGDNRPLLLDGNRASLLHALSETLLNALQSSPADSAVTIEIDTQNELEETWAKVQIIDQGTGFTPDLASKAMNPFFSTRTVGPGLGLTVAKRIIENHHGRLNLLTGDAKGRVAIYLPLKNANNGNGSSIPVVDPPPYPVGQN